MDEIPTERAQVLQIDGDAFSINKSDAVPVVLQWLQNHFEQQHGASIPKHDVYADYCLFCEKHHIEPTSASAFGRLVRLAFPATTSRRLGARGANVTVYNNFRRRSSVSTKVKNKNGHEHQHQHQYKQETAAATPSGRRPYPSYDDHSGISSSLPVDGQPPSPSSVGLPLSLIDEDLHTRLRGGSSKADGRTTTLAHHHPEGALASAGRTSSLGTGQGSWSGGLGDEQSLDLFVSDGGPVADGYIMPTSTSSSSSSARHQRNVVDAMELAMSGESSGSSGGIGMLLKMLKSEENGAELYDSLQRLLRPLGRAVRGNPIEGGSASDKHRPADAGELQFQVFRVPHREERQEEQRNTDPFPTTTSSSSNEQEDRPKLSLWNADTHLHLMKLCETYRDGYSNNLWLLNPLHPAALEDDNIRYIICTDEGSEERSPLSLSIYWILYSGALMEGHIERAIEFYNRSRDHLGYVFDQTDSSTSLVLLPMAYHSRFWAGTEEDGLSKCSYYLTLAMEICKRIGCLGSSVYISCLQMYAWFCMTDNNCLSNEEKLQEVKKGSYYPTMPMSFRATAIPRNAKTYVHIPISHLQMVEKMFGVVGNIMKGIFIFKSTIYSESGHCRLPPLSYPSPSTMPPSSLSSNQEHQQSPYRSQKRKQPEVRTSRPSSSTEGKALRNQHPGRFFQDKQSTGMDGGEEYGSTLDSLEREPLAKQPRQRDHPTAGRRRDLYLEPLIPLAYQNTFLPNATLQPLLLPLDTMDKDLESLMKSDNPLPINIYMMFKLWILGERAECLWCMGQPNDALQMALLFLDISKRSTKNFISHYVSLQPILEMVLNIFLSTFRLHEFRELVDAILEPLNPTIPHVTRSKARYLSALFAADPGFAEAVDIDTSSAAEDARVSRPILANGKSTEDPSNETDSAVYMDEAEGTKRLTNNGSENDESPPFYGNDSEENDQLLGIGMQPL